MTPLQQVILGIFLVGLLSFGYFINQVLLMKTAGEEMSWCLSISRE